MLDVLIKGGTVVDGTGKAGFRADVGIKGEVINAIGDLNAAAASAHRVIDATGLTVSPGFIDTHAHSDGMLLVDPQHANGLRQGITTEILGQDGLSYAPLSNDNYLMYRRYLSGILGFPPEDLDMSSVTAFRKNYHNKVAINTAYNIPHCAVRLEAVGFRDIPLKGKALEKAKNLVREGMEQGAVGFATGLAYFPNSYSDTEEIIELCRAANEKGGVYVTHLRTANPERGFEDGGVPEALEIGRQSGIPVHFSHYKTTPQTPGQVAQVTELIDKAKVEGVDSTMELYPYPSGSTVPLYFLPAYFHEDGPDAMLAKLKDEDEVKKLADFIDDNYDDRVEDAVFSHVPSEKNRHLEGRSFSDVATERGISRGSLICQIILDEDLAVCFRGAPPKDTATWRQIDSDTIDLLSRPDYMVGSDAIPLGSLPHPRAYGTFPRVLGRLRRRSSVLSLEDLVQRVSDNPARRFGLKKRGRLEKGYYADIVVFDQNQMIDTATYDDPCQYPVGIPFVLVNGKVAVDNEKCTSIMAGQAVP